MCTRLEPSERSSKASLLCLLAASRPGFRAPDKPRVDIYGSPQVLLRQISIYGSGGEARLY